MSLFSRLVGSRLIRNGADSAFSRYARRRTRQIDQRSTTQLQEQTLLRLVRHAQHTIFGRDHGFAQIRSIADYHRRVPLREYESFWSEYWQPSFPHVNNATWPGSMPYFSLSSGTTSGSTKYIPVSREMLASNRRAAMTSLAWYRTHQTDARLFTGRMFFLGGSTALTPHPHSFGKTLVGDLSGIAAREVSSFLRPYTYPSLNIALLTDWEEKLDVLVRESINLPITLISGVPSWLLVLFDRMRQRTGQERIIDIWPTLRVVVHGGTRFDPYRGLFRRVVGEGVDFLETYPASEGFVAAEDPRHGLLRLVPDHGIFYEFVPVAEVGRERPSRHTIREVETGVQYAVVLTTCAGLWSYVLGDTVCFENRNPPLLRFSGRTKQFLSAFGEHLIGEEVEIAVARAARATDCEANEFHAGPIFPGDGCSPGRHRFLVEFTKPPQDACSFANSLDIELTRINEDYLAHRAGNLTMLAPEVVVLPRGAFSNWMRSRGKLGGQHKVPRLDNTGIVTRELSEWAQVDGNQGVRP
jgi:hypothetical protein